MICTGNNDEHCCWVAGKECQFLEENTVSGRRWACGLLRELGNWSAVHNDERYLTNVRPQWDKVNVPDCGDFYGGTRPDGLIDGQCCFKGLILDKDGNVLGKG